MCANLEDVADGIVDRVKSGVLGGVSLENLPNDERDSYLRSRFYAWVWPYISKLSFNANNEMMNAKARFASFAGREMGLSADMPIRFWVGHDPSFGRVQRGDQFYAGRDIIAADGGMAGVYRKDKKLQSEGGIVTLSHEGKMTRHLL